MKRKNTKVIATILCFMLFSLTACASDSNTIEGKYISCFDSSIYYTLSNGNAYETNDSWNFPINNSNGSYEITNNKLVLYANNNKKYKMDLGVIYNNHICSIWEGVLPTSDKNTEISMMLIENLIARIRFEKNNTYEHIVTSNEQVISTEYGTYSIDGNKVICTSEENATTTFFNTNVGVLRVEYTKE